MRKFAIVERRFYCARVYKLLQPVLHRHYIFAELYFFLSVSKIVHTTTHRDPLATVIVVPPEIVTGPADMPDVPAAIV